MNVLIPQDRQARNNWQAFLLSLPKLERRILIIKNVSEAKWWLLGGVVPLKLSFLEDAFFWNLTLYNGASSPPDWSV